MEPEEVCHRFWKNLPYNPAIYGGDSPGTLMTDEVTTWNLRKLGSLLDLLVASNGKAIPGVDTPFLYFGMWKVSKTCLHM